MSTPPPSESDIDLSALISDDDGLRYLSRAFVAELLANVLSEYRQADPRRKREIEQTFLRPIVTAAIRPKVVADQDSDAEDRHEAANELRELLTGVVPEADDWADDEVDSDG